MRTPEAVSTLAAETLVPLVVVLVVFAAVRVRRPFGGRLHSSGDALQALVDRGECGGEFVERRRLLVGKRRVRVVFSFFTSAPILATTSSAPTL